MKKSVFLLFPLILCFLTGISAQTISGTGPVPIAGVVSINPATAGAGFAFSANASGYNSFFYNPAGFAEKNPHGNVTALSINTWIVGDPKFWNMVSNPAQFTSGISSQVNEFGGYLRTAADGFSSRSADGMVDALNALSQIGNTEDVYKATTDYLKSQGTDNSYLPTYQEVLNNPEKLKNWSDTNKTVLENLDLQQIGELAKTAAVSFFTADILRSLFSGIPTHARAGLNVGFGYTGNGLGLGLLVNFDAAFSNLASLDVTVSPTIMLNAGYALKLLDDRLLVGFNVRPMIKLSYLQLNVSAKTVETMLVNPSSAKNMMPLYSGWGAGLDVGAIYKITPNWYVSAVLKDAPSFFSMYRPNTDNFSSIFSSGGFFSERIPNAFFVPPDLGFGVAFKSGKSKFLQWSISAQIDHWIPMLVYRSYYGMKFEPLDMFKIGATFTPISLVTLSAGYGSGYITAGAFFDLLIFNIGISAAYRPSIVAERNAFGLSAEIAIRF